jgi:hypothetical protein
MLGLYSLGFCLVLAVKVISSHDSAKKKLTYLLLLAPVIAYIAMQLRIVTPIIAFVMKNIKNMV